MVTICTTFWGRELISGFVCFFRHCGSVRSSRARISCEGLWKGNLYLSGSLVYLFVSVRWYVLFCGDLVEGHASRDSSVSEKNRKRGSELGEGGARGK